MAKCSAFLFLTFFTFGSPFLRITNLNVPPFLSINKDEAILSCEYEHGDDIVFEDLTKLQWFFNEQLFYEWIPNNTSAAMGRLEKNVDLNYKLHPPSENKNVIRLINISPKLTGNYTCKLLGWWTHPLQTKSMFIYKEPTLKEINYQPKTVVKGKPVTLKCLLADPGHPTNISYIWYRRGYKIHESVEPSWTINQASLDTRTIFSCVATNGPGESSPQEISINVIAPPAILEKTTSYKAVSYLSKTFSLPCKIECYPLCSIVWYKDGRLLDTKTDPSYQEVVMHYPPDPTKNDFESTESTLIWTFSEWSNSKLEKNSPPSKYTCASVSVHGPGPNVNSTVSVFIDTPPENLKLSHYRIDLEEGQEAPSVECKGDGLPKLEYLWKNKYSEVIATGNTLRLGNVTRGHKGYYVCEGSNKYGKETAKVHVNVQYKPDCTLTTGVLFGKHVVICSADGGSNKVSFTWEILDSNETIDEEHIDVKKDFGIWYSYLVPKKSNETMIYQCTATNSIGFSNPCQIEVSGAPRKEGLLTRFWRLITMPIISGWL